MIRVVASHHEALEEWARYRRTREEAPSLLTFDHHTDTLPAFGRAAADEATRLRMVRAFDFRSESSVAEALALLRHDEQIDLALRGGVVSRSVIVAHADHPGCANERIRVVCDRSWPDLQILLNDPEQFRPLAERVFESAFLRDRLAEAEFVPEAGFIFDLDLDYLLVGRALVPEDGELLRNLLGRAGLVTVSLEAEWVKLLRIDPGVSAESLLATFRELYETIPPAEEMHNKSSKNLKETFFCR